MTSRTMVLLLLSAASTAQKQEFVAPLPPNASFEVRHYAYDTEAKLETDIFIPPLHLRIRAPYSLSSTDSVGRSCASRRRPRVGAKAATAHGFVAITEDTTAGHISADFNNLTTFLAKNAHQLQLDPARITVIAWSGNVPAAMETLQSPALKFVKAAIFYYGVGEVSAVRLDLPALFVRAGLDQPAMNHSIDHTIATGLTANAPWTVLNYPGRSPWFRCR